MRDRSDDEDYRQYVSPVHSLASWLFCCKSCATLLPARASEDLRAAISVVNASFPPSSGHGAKTRSCGKISTTCTKSAAVRGGREESRGPRGRRRRRSPSRRCASPAPFSLCLVSEPLRLPGWCLHFARARFRLGQREVVLVALLVRLQSAAPCPLLLGAALTVTLTPRQRLRLSHQHLLLANTHVQAGGQRAAIKKKEKCVLRLMLGALFALDSCKNDSVGFALLFSL